MIGPTELIIILVIIIVVFGATKLPQLGDALGRSIRNFKSAMSEGKKPDEGSEKNGDSTKEDGDQDPPRES